jgi:hypothetical protein
MRKHANNGAFSISDIDLSSGFEVVGVEDPPKFATASELLTEQARSRGYQGQPLQIPGPQPALARIEEISLITGSPAHK